MINAANSVQVKQLLDSRASSLTHRILAGASSAALVAYRSDGAAQLTSLAHGLASDGTLVVAANLAAESVPEVFCEEDILDVRVDLMKFSSELDIRIVSATTHLLGTLEWLSPAEAELAFQDLLLPTHLVALAREPGGRLGIVHADRVVTHTSNGITSFAYPELAARHRTCDVLFSQRIDVIAAELALTADGDRLGMFAAALAEGWFDGLVLSRRETTEGCEQAHGRTFVVDLDHSGLTLMQVGREETRVVFAPFPAPAHTERQLRASLAELLDLPVIAEAGE